MGANEKVAATFHPEVERQPSSDVKKVKDDKGKRLLKARRILHRNGDGRPGYVRFVQYTEEAVHDTTNLQFIHEDWEDMGRPEVITLTIEPGDHLNPVQDALPLDES